MINFRIKSPTEIAIEEVIDILEDGGLPSILLDLGASRVHADLETAELKEALEELDSDLDAAEQRIDQLVEMMHKQAKANAALLNLSIELGARVRKLEEAKVPGTSVIHQPTFISIDPAVGPDKTVVTKVKSALQRMLPFSSVPFTAKLGTPVGVAGPRIPAPAARPAINVHVSAEVARDDMYNHPDTVYARVEFPSLRYRFHEGRFQRKDLDEAGVFENGKNDFTMSPCGEYYAKENSLTFFRVDTSKPLNLRPRVGELVSIVAAYNDMKRHPRVARYRGVGHAIYFFDGESFRLQGMTAQGVRCSLFNGSTSFDADDHNVPCMTRLEDN